jgi:hypothetical protein
MEAQFKDWQSGKVLVREVGDPAFFLSRKSMANYGQVEFIFLGESNLPRYVRQGNHVVTLFFQNEVAGHAQHFCMRNGKDSSHLVKGWADYISASVPKVNILVSFPTLKITEGEPARFFQP